MQRPEHRFGPIKLQQLTFSMVRTVYRWTLTLKEKQLGTHIVRIRALDRCTGWRVEEGRGRLRDSTKQST
eukprot:1140791-Pelagomonas_calceolata.AAC.6